MPFPLPGDLPDPGIELVSPASPALAGRFFTTAPLGKLKCDLLDPKRYTQVQSLGWEDSLEKGMATHSSIPA